MDLRLLMADEVRRTGTVDEEKYNKIAKAGWYSVPEGHNEDDGPEEDERGMKRRRTPSPPPQSPVTEEAEEAEDAVRAPKRRDNGAQDEWRVLIVAFPTEKAGDVQQIRMAVPAPPGCRPGQGASDGFPLAPDILHRLPSFQATLKMPSVFVEWNKVEVPEEMSEAEAACYKAAHAFVHENMSAEDRGWEAASVDFVIFMFGGDDDEDDLAEWAMGRFPA